MERKVSYSVAQFAAKFCTELGTDKTSICSPLSAEIVLALLALGCKNKTHEELLNALDVANDKAIRSSYSFLTSTLRAVKGATLNVANKVYVKKGSELKPGIEKDAKKVFRSSLEQIDFDDREAAADIINSWVAKQTNDKITNIVSPEMMTDYTRLFLVNAIYFEGLWLNPFQATSTTHSNFRVNKTTTIYVPMMSCSNKHFNYGVSQELEAKLLQMKYQGGEASMVIVLPDEVEGLKSVLQKLASGHNIMADIESMKRTELYVKVPKFTVETTIDLRTLLPKLGITSIFEEENAEIDMLKSDEELFVSKAIQKALIIVDESGTKAAACTVGRVEVLCLVEKEEFVANRPFLFLLTVRKIPTFIGIYKGSEYAETPCSDVSESDLAKIKMFIDFINRRKHPPIMLKPDTQKPDTQTPDKQTRHSPIESHKAPTTPMCARCEIQ